MVLACVELLPQIFCIPRREEPPRVESGVDGAAMRCTFLLAILPSYWPSILPLECQESLTVSVTGLCGEAGKSTKRAGVGRKP